MKMLILSAILALLSFSASAQTNCAQVSVYQYTNSACVQVCSADLCAATGGSIPVGSGSLCTDSPKNPSAIFTVTIVDGCSIFDPCKVKAWIPVVVTCPNGILKTAWAQMSGHMNTRTWYVVVHCDISGDCQVALCLLHESCI